MSRDSVHVPTIWDRAFGIEGDEHIIDRLIAERAAKLSTRPEWALIRPLLFSAFRYREAVRVADHIAPMGGHETMAFVADRLRLDVRLEGAERLPREGGFILAPNHPTGLADGVAVYQALMPIRPDLVFFANRDALRVVPRLRDVLIPVEWRAAGKSFAKSRDTLTMTAEAFNRERAVVLFPSGRIAFWHEGALTERPWRGSLVALARKYRVPIIPAGITGRNSSLFYLLSRFHSELRDMMLFRELLNKNRKSFVIRIGEPIEPDDLVGDADEIVARLRQHTSGELARP